MGLRKKHSLCLSVMKAADLVVFSEWSFDLAKVNRSLNNQLPSLKLKRVTITFYVLSALHKRLEFLSLKACDPIPKPV